MKINVIACCKNEEKILPFFLEHYSSFCDTIMICDGYSTDNSANIIKQFPKAILVRLDKGTELNDGELMEIRNHYYKQFRDGYDWQIVVDVDEFLYHPNMIALLEEYKRDGVNLPWVAGFDMGSLTFPTAGIPLTQQITRGQYDKIFLCKSAIFDPQIDIRYKVGCHWCYAENVNRGGEAQIKLLHYKFLSYQYLQERSRWSEGRRSQYNKDHNYGVHYTKLMEMSEEEYRQMVERMKLVI